MNADDSEQFELLADQFVEQLRAGNSPNIEELAKAHPTIAEKIRRLFPVMKMMESKADSFVDDEALLQEELNQLAGVPSQQKLGEYMVIREIGRGGMGIVYQARQESLGRYVAIKLLPQSASFDERRYKRFQQEARASGMLVHSNIVPVFGIGRSDEVSYFVMQYIDGISLDKVISELRTVRQLDDGAANSLNDTKKSIETSVSGAAWSLLSSADQEVASDAESDPNAEMTRANAETAPASSSDISNVSLSQLSALSRRNQYFRNVAKIGLQVSDALQHAHRHKILHRDIKPANLLLESNGHAWVTDFGLAKLIDEANITRTGETVGTLRYLPPEQFNGRSDVRSDVYSLGLTLYELLTLTPAFEGADFAKLLHNVTEREPLAPRKIDPRIPRDLETIVMKSIAREPEGRYQTAGDLHNDLALFLDGKPILAKQASELERLIKAMKRRPVVSTLSVLLLSALIIGSALVTWKWQEATSALKVAEAEVATRQDINDFLFLDLLNYAQPQLEPDPDVKLRTVFDRAADKIEQRFGDRPLVEADMRLRVGRIYMGLSKPDIAKQNFERALQLRSEQLGVDDPLADEALYEIALAEHELGHYQRSLDMLNEVSAIQEQRFGSRSVEAMRVKLDVADVLNSTGQYRQAVDAIDDYIAFASSTPELFGDSLHQSQLSHGQILIKMAEYDKAKKLLDSLVPKVRHAWTSDGGEYNLTNAMLPDFYLYLSVQNSLATIAEHQGFPQQAIEVHRDNFDITSRFLGPEHSTTLSYAANLARALLNSDQPDEARQLLDQQIPISLESRGRKHPRTLALQSVLAILLFKNGEFESAEAIMTEVRDSAKGRFGVDHPDSVNYDYNIAAIYYRTGQFERSADLMSDVVDRSRRILGDEHPQTIVALADLATAHANLGKFELAEQEFIEALALSRLKMRPHHPELLTTIMSFALFYQRAGYFDRAEPLLQEWLDGLKASRGVDDPSVIIAKNSLAIAYAQQNKLDLAVPLYVECYEFHRTQSGPCAARTINVLLALTEYEYKMRNHQANANRLQQFCEDCEQSMDLPGWQYLKAQSLLGRSYWKLKQYGRAESELIAAFEGMRSFGGDVPQTARLTDITNTASRLAAVYQKTGPDDKFQAWKKRHREWSAKSRQQKVVDYSRQYGKGHSKTIQAKRHLASRLMQLDRDKEAYELLIEVFENDFEKESWNSAEVVGLAMRLAVLEHSLERHEETVNRLDGFLAATSVDSDSNWSRSKAKSYLGRAKLELGQFPDAERLLLETFDELQAMESEVDSAAWRSEMRKAANRLMELYDRIEDTDSENVWREKYRQYKQPDD